MPTVSHSWKASEPISEVGTWPVMQTSGIESISASCSGVTALVAPGPEVTSMHAGLAGRAGIAFGGMAGTLLVADQNVLTVVLLEQLVIDRQHRAAGIAEDVLDAVVLQRLDHHFGARSFRGGRLRRVRCSSIVAFRRSPRQACASFPSVSSNKKGPSREPCVQRMGGFRPAVTPPCPCAFLLREWLSASWQRTLEAKPAIRQWLPAQAARRCLCQRKFRRFAN